MILEVEISTSKGIVKACSFSDVFMGREEKQALRVKRNQSFSTHPCQEHVSVPGANECARQSATAMSIACLCHLHLISLLSFGVLFH